MYCTNGGDFYNRNNIYSTFSDRRIKENVNNVRDNYLEDVMKIRTVNYNQIGDDLKQIGHIAQEVQEVFPGLVENNDKDILVLKTSILHGLILFKEFQEHVTETRKQINELKSENEMLKQEILQLKEEIKQLKELYENIKK